MNKRCNICGDTRFQDFRGRSMIQCQGCNSLERGRLMALHLQMLQLPAAARVLHIAPEEGIYRLLSERSEIGEYTVADYSPELYKFVACVRIDLCGLEDWPSDSYDLILHSHVLEHTRCNIAYTLFHLHRMLSSAGRHMFVLPFTTGSYDESFQEIKNEERIRRFGQWDHLRRFGLDDVGDHIGRIVRIPTDSDMEARFGRNVLLKANIPEAFWYGLNAATVINLGKTDYRLT